MYTSSPSYDSDVKMVAVAGEVKGIEERSSGVCGCVSEQEGCATAIDISYSHIGLCTCGGNSSIRWRGE